MLTDHNRSRMEPVIDSNRRKLRTLKNFGDKFKQMKKIRFFKSSSSILSTRVVLPPATSVMMDDEKVEVAESLIYRWDFDSSKEKSCSFNSLFWPENRNEGKLYLNVVIDLQTEMERSLVQCSTDPNLVRAQMLIAMAMKRLEKEFRRILLSTRDYLDPESVSTQSSGVSWLTVSESKEDSDSDSDSESESGDETDVDESMITEVERAALLAVEDLKAISSCMIASGYSKECGKVYTSIRKSIVDEALCNLSVERLSFSQIQKMETEVVEVKISRWLHAVNVTVKSLFRGERIVCDLVFAASPKTRDHVFDEICRDGSLWLFGFPKNVARSCKKSPEILFRILDLYGAISSLSPEIESIFGYDSDYAVRTIVEDSKAKLRDSVLTILTNFESTIQKDSLKSPLDGAGIHPLTRYVMNYVSFLADYSEVLSEIISDFPPDNVQLAIPEKSSSSPIAIRIAWLILLLLCKIDAKSRCYKEIAQSYLSLANNLRFMIQRVENSNLKLLLGDEWLVVQEETVRHYSARYKRVGWSKVVESLPEDPTAEMTADVASDHFRRFSAAFAEAYEKQSSWVIPEPRMREEIKISLARNICWVYQEFYNKYGTKLRRERWVDKSIVRFTPEEVGNYLSDLFTTTR